MSTWIEAASLGGLRVVRLQQLGDPPRAEPGMEVEADQVRVVLVVDAVVRGDDEPRARVLRPRELLVGEVALPLVVGGPARDGGGAVAGAPQREPPRALVADRAVDVGVHDVLARAPQAAQRLAELLERRRAHELGEHHGLEETVGGGPPQREGAVHAGELVAGHTDRRGLQDRAVPGLPHVERDRGATADLDRLRVHDERFPIVVELGGGPLVVQALDVEVLDVAAHVRQAPRVVRRRPGEDARDEGQRDPAGLVPGRPQVELEPRRRLLHEQVRIVGQQRASARRPRTRDDPAVRALPARTREPVQQPPRERARREPGRVDRRRRKECRRGLGAEPLGQPEPEQFVVPVAREAPREVGERRRPALEILGELGGHPEHRVLERRGRHRLDPRPGPVDEPPHHRPRCRAPAPRLAHPDPVEPDRPREPVGRDREVREPSREAPARRAQRELDLEQPLRRLHEPLREPQVVQRSGGQVGDPPPVPQDLDRFAEPRDRQLALDRRECRACGVQELFERIGHGAGAYPLAPDPRRGACRERG